MELAFRLLEGTVRHVVDECDPQRSRPVAWSQAQWPLPLDRKMSLAQVSASRNARTRLLGEGM